MLYYYQFLIHRLVHTFENEKELTQMILVGLKDLFNIQNYQNSIVSNSSSLSEIFSYSSSFSATIGVCDSDCIGLCEGVIVTVGVDCRGCHTLGQADG